MAKLLHLPIKCLVKIVIGYNEWSGRLVPCRRRPLSASSGNILSTTELHRPFGALLNRPHSSPLGKPSLTIEHQTGHANVDANAKGQHTTHLAAPVETYSLTKLHPAADASLRSFKSPRNTPGRRPLTLPNAAVQPLSIHRQLVEVQRISGPSGE
jgi:hypothetical protein